MSKQDWFDWADWVLGKEFTHGVFAKYGIQRKNLVTTTIYEIGNDEAYIVGTSEERALGGYFMGLLQEDIDNEND